MSYSVYAYLTDAAKVKAMYGSKNEKIYSELRTALKDDFTDLNSCFFPDNSKDTSSILLDLIKGTIKQTDHPYLYGYIYEKICEYYGEQIYNSENTWMLDTQSAFIPIPFSNDYPYIISVEPAMLRQKKQKYTSLKEGEGIGDYDYEEELDDLNYIFDKAIEQQKDLVICVY